MPAKKNADGTVTITRAPNGTAKTPSNRNPLARPIPASKRGVSGAVGDKKPVPRRQR